MEKFPDGVYELVHSLALQNQLIDEGRLEDTNWRDGSPEEIYHQLAVLLARDILSLLKEGNSLKKGSSNSSISDSVFSKKESIIELIQSNAPIDLRFLKEISKGDEGIPESSFPDTPLSVSALLTGSSRSPVLRTQLKKELQTCSRADWLVSFIKLSGILPLLPALKDFTRIPTEDGLPRLRIATTSYMGATDVKAIEKLLELPNTEIRISYDTKRTRLHAKAYLFHRESGFSSAYIGSANISKAALDDGLEWTAKISQFESPHLWQSCKATFGSHWEDESEFSRCDKGDLEKLSSSIQAEKNQNRHQNTMTSFFDIRPYGFQQIILDDIELERKNGERKHLVIAATGTGKTMIAGFDYRQFRKAYTGNPRLLFIAHREEILKQALISFRQILRDGSFGDLVTGNFDPLQRDYLFCTVQSWNSKGLDKLAPEHFDYIVLDEAHHASAASYQKLIQHINPISLIGLTATPERSDGKDIRDDFWGRFTHEIRLPEAIDRALLSPFHYYGIPDSPDIDFSGLNWKRGRYDQLELKNLLEANLSRATWVMSQLDKHVADIHSIKCLGFCVSVEHAKFMASFCQEAGIRSIALTGESSAEERRNADRRISLGELQIIFTVDLYNEGIDIPQIDTVLFLRPTESLTLFLQQLGRGLRLHPDKSHVTVLDFIAPQHSRFSYSARFNALTSNTSLHIRKQLEKDMPFLPTACVIQLEKAAKEFIIENIKAATANLKGKRLLNELLRLQAVNSSPSLSEILTFLDISDPDKLIQIGLPHGLLSKSKGKSIDLGVESYYKQLQGGFRRLLLMDDTKFLKAAIGIYRGKEAYDKQVIAQIQTVLWGKKKPGEGSLAEVHSFFVERPALKQDLLELLEWIVENKTPTEYKSLSHISEYLSIHCSYTREQILLGLGYGSFDSRKPSREGLLHIPDKKLDVFFADINKLESDFSPTTMYEDYAITTKLFHWQSQSQTHPESPVGKRYIQHQEYGYTPLLFIRNRKKHPNGLTSPYFFAGPLKYRRHEGARPISIVWELEYELPAKVFAWAKRD